MRAPDGVPVGIRYREGLRTDDGERFAMADGGDGGGTTEVAAGGGQLVAVRCPPQDAGQVLRRLWRAGAAVLLLPPEAPDVLVAGILAAQRPASLLDLVTSAPGGSRAQAWSPDTERSGRGDLPGGPRPDPLPGDPLPDPLPVAEDVALVVTTSGSTGRPKGVELTHAALRASTAASLRRLGCRTGQRWALALPTHHVAGVQVLLRSWTLSTDAEVVTELAELATCRADHVSLVPTQLGRLLDLGVDVARFATILLGGARPAPQLLARARTAGANVVVSYGMSETCGGCVYDGVPLDGVEAEVVDGRVRLRGDVLFGGYRNDPAGSAAAVDADGWFTTGDRGRYVGGRLEVTGRADDVIVSGGEKIPAAAVEATLRTAPGVREVAVVPRPDPEWGELVVAVVVPDDPARPPTLTQLRAHVRAVHPPAYAPRVLVLLDELPRDAMGKMSRAALRGPTDDA